MTPPRDPADPGRDATNPDERQKVVPERPVTRNLALSSRLRRQMEVELRRAEPEIRHRATYAKLPALDSEGVEKAGPAESSPSAVDAPPTVEPEERAGQNSQGNEEPEPPRFIPARNEHIFDAARGEQQPEVIRATTASPSPRSTIGRAADSSGDATSAATATTATEDPETRREERARRVRRHRILTRFGWAAAALAVLGFLAGSVWNPFGRAAQERTGETAAPTASSAAITASPGQCFGSFQSVWDTPGDAVPCTGAHAAEFLARVPAGDFAGKPFPGAATLRSRAQLACQSPKAVSADARTAYPDLLVDVRYARTEAEWNGGMQSYDCYVMRPNNGMLTGTLPR